MNSLDGKLYVKIGREAKRLGIKIQKCEYYANIKAPYWRVKFLNRSSEYTYKGFLWEVGLRLGLIGEDDIREARGRTEIPPKQPRQQFWVATWAWGGGLHPL